MMLFYSTTRPTSITSTCCILLALLVATTSSTRITHLRNQGGDDTSNNNPFYCTLQHSHDSEHCINHEDCYWCQGGSLHGICVSKQQSDAFIDKIPGVKCESSPSPSSSSNTADSPNEGAPYDSACLTAGMEAADGDQEEACDAAVSDEDGASCVWCDGAGIFGLCLSSTQAAQASTYLQCDNSSTKTSYKATAKTSTIATDIIIDSQNPYDITCAVAGYTAGDAGHDVCKTTSDVDGSPCVWCSSSNAAFPGLCLNDHQAVTAEQMNLDCDTSTFLGTFHDSLTANEFNLQELTSPFDITCAMAGISDGPQICLTTVDEEGSPCVWCSASDGGLCVTHDQADIAQQVGIDCSSAIEEVATDTDMEDNPYDVTCAIAGYTAGNDGESVCKTTQDDGGDTCVWCSYGGQGLCLTDEQAEIAGQMQFQCDASSNIEEVATNTDMEDNPYDPTCAVAGYTAGDDGESVCKTTQDDDGDACVWCSYGGQGLCLTDEQAEIAGQMQFQCDASSNIEEVATDTDMEDNPYDVTCAIAGYTAGDAGEDACKTTEDQDGDACVWCTYGGQGLCLNDEQAEIAGQMQFECNNKMEDPIPPTVKDCLKNLEEDGCNGAADSTGVTCTWCNTVVGFGLCFSEQAKELAEAQFGPLFQCDDIISIEIE